MFRLSTSVASRLWFVIPTLYSIVLDVDQRTVEMEALWSIFLQRVPVVVCL